MSSIRKSAVYVAITILAACSGRVDPTALVASAKDHMAKQEYGSAVIQLKNALQAEPDNTEARYLLGISSLEQGDYYSASIELSKAKQSGYAGEELRVAVARTMLATGEHTTLIDDFQARKLSNPKLQAELQAIVGAALLAQGRRSEARASFNDALAIDAASPTANLGIARLAASEADWSGALARVEKALKDSPDNFEALLFKADLLAVRGENDAAEQLYRQATAARPQHMTPRLALIGQLLRTRSLDKAAIEVAALDKMAPKDPRTYYVKASLFTEQGSFSAARDAVLQVLKVAPEHVPSLMIAGRAAVETGAYSEAESHFRKASQTMPNLSLAKRFLIAAHLRMGQTEVALGEVKELMSRAPNDPNVAVLAGEVYLANGDVASAARQYERAKSLVPDNASLQTRLALVRLAAGETDRAVKELQASSASHVDDYQADLALIATYLRQQDAAKALQAVNELEKKQPQNPLTYHLRGVAQLLNRDEAAARASFEHALKLNPSYMPAVTNLAQLDLRERKPEAARSRYEAVLTKEPNNEQALSSLAVLMRITGAPKAEIEKQLRQAVASNPSSQSIRIALVNFYWRNGELEKAATAAQEADAAIPNNPIITEALGAAQLAAGDTRQAIGSYQKLVELSPRAPQPLVLLARAQLAKKMPDDALRSLRAALALKPDIAVVEHDIANVYVASGRYEDALEEARKVQKEYPGQPLGYVLEGEIYLSQKKLDAAEHTYRAAVSKFDLPILVVRTHSILAHEKRVGEADALAERWISTHPKDTLVLIYLAERDRAQKGYAEAERRYRTALERDPNSAAVLNNLALVASELKQPKAREYAERANELAPDSPPIMDTLGVILSQAGEHDRALQLLGRAAEFAPQAYLIRLNFAKALAKAGRKEAARKELETLVKLDPSAPVQQEAAALLASLQS
ncbi:MAG TPA: XrtA/PEP-CTERM system TPR-repeat protein PrsT [Burkholderiales bacterium]|nr:XrtA/PEP-CTERM system TPR-repeat protein PrsT [Burkholderiales bacterium]